MSVIRFPTPPHRPDLLDMVLDVAEAFMRFVRRVVGR